MNAICIRTGLALLSAVMTTILSHTCAKAEIIGVHGPNFQLTAKADYISTADGNSIAAWGYAVAGGRMQYPGPTLIVNQGDTVTITLTNELPENVSIVFPGQRGVTASGGPLDRMAREARPGGQVVYSFVAREAGTYHYHSGTRPEIQVEMGLVGALIVRPSGFDPNTKAGRRAYDSADSQYDREYLFLLTEMDADIHSKISGGNPVDNSGYWPVYWFVNGRNAPDTVDAPGVAWLPTQPYNALAQMMPGERVLMRVIGAGRHMHPFHAHGNHQTVIARDGRLLESAPGNGADLAVSDFTIQAIPGGSYDAIFQWTGTGLGWDVYGHDDANPATLLPFEDPNDHGKPFPVVFPDDQDVQFGEHFSGSPFLGVMGNLPPGQGGMNMNSGLFFMWHSHAEKEMTNFDIFPGGMMTMLIVEPPGALPPVANE